MKLGLVLLHRDWEHGAPKEGLLLDNDGGKGRNTRWCRNVENISMLRQIEDQVGKDEQLGVSKKKNHQNDFLWKMKYFDVTAKSLGLRIFLQGKQTVKYDRQIFSTAGSRKGELWSHRRVQRRFGVLRLKRV